jgi:ribonucleoside-diphosphate reductase alpha chain
MAKVWNKKMFEHIKRGVDEASVKLAHERGACPDAEECGIMERFTNKMAIAPTASISIIAGNSSPGIEPYAANSFVQKTLTGSFTVKNKWLKKVLETKDEDNEDTWASISSSEGSVQHLDFLSQDEKDVFKTAQEMDQRWIVEHAADRTPYICQAQSINLFMPGNVHKRDLHQTHFAAWKKGVKSLYYCRSTSIQRSEKVSHKAEMQLEMSLKQPRQEAAKYDECLACQ